MQAPEQDHSVVGDRTDAGLPTARAAGSDAGTPGSARDQQERTRLLVEALRAAVRQARRLIIFLLGTTVVLIGVIMFFTPGPAIVVIPVGLGILAIEFAWARLLLKRFRERAEKLGAGVADRFRKESKPR